MEDKKVISPLKIVDFRMIRPIAYLPKDSHTVYHTQQVSQFYLKKDSAIRFFTPNGATLFYNKAKKEYEAGVGIYKEVIKKKIKTGLTYNVTPEDLPRLYDYLECIQSCIIMIYSSIEALANVAIPEDYELKKINNRGVTELWNKANIEKWSSTSEKVGTIVPEILGIASPKILPLWEKFLKLKDIRDQIIHQKQSINTPYEIESSFLALLLNETVFEKINAGFDLVHFFCEKDETHTYFPMLQDDTPIKVNFIDNKDEIPGYKSSSSKKIF